MFAPPQTFDQLAALQWAAPLLTLLSWAGVGAALGLPASAVVALGVTASALAAGGALVAVWASGFGTRHTRWAAIATHLALGLPLALILLPAGLEFVGEQAISVGMAAAVLGVVHSLLLLIRSSPGARGQAADGVPDSAASAAPRAGHLASKPASGTRVPGHAAGLTQIRWDGLTIDTDKATWAEEPSASAAPRGRGWLHVVLICAAVAAVGHLMEFSALRGQTAGLLAFVLGNGVCAWLAWGPLGRGMRRARALSAWEQRQGRVLSHQRMKAFERRRAHSRLGSWVRRVVSGAAPGRP